jgi:RNA recognition motif-containing protein
MGKRLYVGNLPFSYTSANLEDLFGVHGQVTQAQVVMDRVTNRSRGFGFVEFATGEAADKAIAELNGKPVDGRPLTVNEARDRTPGGGGGGGGGFGRGPRGPGPGGPGGGGFRDRDRGPRY